jgi:hypothetical protein
MSRGLGDVLLLIPCCGAKEGNGLSAKARPGRVDTELSEKAFALLTDGRRKVAERFPQRFDQDSPLLPATAWYTGNPYKVPGFRDALDGALERGMHCLIVSAGYGLLRPDELIHKYNLKMSETLTIWRGVLPRVLEDYIAQNAIRTVFGAMSKKYYDAAAGVSERLSNVGFWWCVPRHDRDAGGAATQQIPEAVGHAVTNLIADDFKPDSRWTRDHTAHEGAHKSISYKAVQCTTGSPHEVKGMPHNLEAVWERIEAHQGEEFRQLRGQVFRYSAKGSYITPTTTNHNIPKQHFGDALRLVPLKGPGQINHLRGPSYIFAILMDPRIRRQDW